MNIVSTNSFYDLTREEATDISGGVGVPSALVVAATVASVAAGVYVAYQLGEATGKFLYNITH